MLTNTKSKLAEFSREIEEFLDMLRFLEKYSYLCESPKIISTITTENGTDSAFFEIKSSLLNMLKASTYLQIYNMVEAITKSTILTINIGIRSDNLTYKDARNEIKELWLKKQLKRDLPSVRLIQKILSAVDGDECIECDYETLRQEMNGNVNYDKLYNLSELLGFNTKKFSAAEIHKDKMNEVKNKRNSLAHGELSFFECGKDIVFREVATSFNEACTVLQIFMDVAEEFLNKQRYYHYGHVNFNVDKIT